MPRRLSATILATSLILIAFAGLATAAGKPKRGTYIDTKLQVYVTTTKDAASIKSFQAPCMRTLSTGDKTQSGSMAVSRKIKINGTGGFRYSGNAKIYSGNPEAEVGKVTVKATFSGGTFKGTATFPAKYECEVTSFSAKYYGVNPQG